LSKTLMYDFHYNYFKKKYGSTIYLLFTDIDSLCYEIETEDFFKDISADVQEKFDTSNFTPNNPSGIPTGINKKVPGKFKDEAGGEVIEEFVGLRAKLYTIKKLDGGEEKSVRVSRGEQFQRFQRMFTLRKATTKNNECHKHEVSTEQVTKIALFANDDKRIILPDKI